MYVMKNCNSKTCKQLNPQPFSEFYKSDINKDGLLNQCKTCRKIQLKKYAQSPKGKKQKKEYWKKYKQNPEVKLYYTKVRLKKEYNLSIEEHKKMFIDQNYCCAICNKHQSEFTRTFHVDHDHKTGKVRELLCQHCNHLLGNSWENTEILEKAIKYLIKHKPNLLKVIK